MKKPADISPLLSRLGISVLCGRRGRKSAGPGNKKGIFTAEIAKNAKKLNLFQKPQGGFSKPFHLLPI
jgi:hypothetical protein